MALTADKRPERLDAVACRLNDRTVGALDRLRVTPSRIAIAPAIRSLSRSHKPLPPRCP